MGLVIQAPLDALLPAADAQRSSAPAPPEADADGGPFNELLASLSAMLDGPPVDHALSEMIVEVGDIGTGEEEKEGGDPYAALYASSLPLQVPALLATEMAAQAPDEAVAAGGVLPVESFVTPMEVEELLDPSTPVMSDGGSATAVTAETKAAPVSEPVPAEAQQAPSSTILPTENAGAPQEPVRANEPRRGEPPPGGPVAAEANSVVRSVGNAESESDMGSGSPPQDGEKETAQARRSSASARDVANVAAGAAVGDVRQMPDAAPLQAVDALDAPAPTAEMPLQMEQVAQAVIERIDAGGGEARIHLDPAGLGEVTIHVHTDGDSVRIDVRTERQEAASLLRDHTQDLSNLLGDRGLNLSDVNVALGRGNRDQAWGQDSRPESRPVAGEFASVFGNDDASSIENHHRLRAAYNPDGAHLYRV